jgi:hypothetical protein
MSLSPLGAVDGGLDGADVFAGGVLAVLARHRLEEELLGLLVRPGDVAIDAEPVHLPAGHHLILADDGDVVLGLAGDDARLAAGAGRQVDRHAPPVVRVGVGLVQRERLAGAGKGLGVDLFLLLLGREVGLLVVGPQGGGADRLTGLHQVVLLGAGDPLALLGLADRQPGGEPGVLGGAQQVGVEADPLLAGAADPPGVHPAVAQVDGDGAVGVAGHDPDGGADGPVAVLQLDDVGREAAVLAAVDVAADAHAEFLGRPRAHDGRVVPGQLGDRLGQLLGPAVVGEPAVVERRVGLEHDLIGAALLPSPPLGRRGGPQVFLPPLAQADLQGLEPGAGDDAVVDRGLPERLEVAGRLPALPVLAPVVAHGLVTGGLEPAADDGQDLVGGAALVKRLDERLHDRSGAVERPRIAPRLQVVGPRAGASDTAARFRPGRGSCGSAGVPSGCARRTGNRPAP